jgi:hypothetical protein
MAVAMPNSNDPATTLVIPSTFLCEESTFPVQHHGALGQKQIHPLSLHSSPERQREGKEFKAASPLPSRRFSLWPQLFTIEHFAVPFGKSPA